MCSAADLVETVLIQMIMCPVLLDEEIEVLLVQQEDEKLQADDISIISALLEARPRDVRP